MTWLTRQKPCQDPAANQLSFVFCFFFYQNDVVLIFFKKIKFNPADPVKTRNPDLGSGRPPGQVLKLCMKVFTLPCFDERDWSRVSIARYIKGCGGFSQTKVSNIVNGYIYYQIKNKIFKVKLFFKNYFNMNIKIIKTSCEIMKKH